MKSKQSQFSDLVGQVQACALCNRMSKSRRVLSNSNGNMDSPVVFIAEAPGRLGADKFGIPLFGDQTGRNFDKLISGAGIKREEIFITNAVLCNPRKANGNNDSPTISEIRNCSVYLKRTIDIISPKYVVPLGRAAIASLNVIEPHEIMLSKSVGTLFPWDGYQVYPLYHPGPRSFVWRNRSKQIADYRLLASFLVSNTLQEM